MRLTLKAKAQSLSENNTHATIEAKWSAVIAKCGYTAIPNMLLICSKELGITPPEFMTLAAILSFKWDERRPTPSVGTICKLTNSTTRTARKHIASLEKKGLLKRVERNYQTNEYDFSPLVQKLDKLAQMNLPDCQSVPEGTVTNDQGLRSEVPAKEDTYKQDEVNKNNRVSDDTADLQQVRLVYDYFIKQFDSDPAHYKLTPKRKTKIKARLRDCGYDMLTLAIDNVAATGFYRGDNERGWKADLDFITRSYEQVEKLSQLNAQTVTYRADW